MFLSEGIPCLISRRSPIMLSLGDSVLVCHTYTWQEIKTEHYGTLYAGLYTARERNSLSKVNARSFHLFAPALTSFSGLSSPQAIVFKLPLSHSTTSSGSSISNCSENNTWLWSPQTLGMRRERAKKRYPAFCYGYFIPSEYNMLTLSIPLKARDTSNILHVSSLFENTLSAIGNAIFISTQTA